MSRRFKNLSRRPGNVPVLNRQKIKLAPSFRQHIPDCVKKLEV